MIAVFVGNSGIITAWFPNLESEEEIEGLNYVLFDELPIEITNNVNGDILVIDKETKEISVLIVEPEPEQPPTPEQVRISQLEQENIDLMLAVTQIYEEKEAEKAAAEEESINTM
jgi:hypothetical protein